MTAATIAAALDGRREGRDWRCRCPLHGGHSLVISDSPVGRLLVKCWGGGCDPRDILAELRGRGLIAGRGDVAPPIPATTRSDDRADTTRRIALARRIWAAAKDARGSAVERYLAGPCRHRCAGRRAAGIPAASICRRWLLGSTDSTAI
jgi:putative DNA primase/helicase